MDIGLPELLVVLVILLLLFGANRLPKLSRSIGQSARELRDGLNGNSADTTQAASNTQGPKENKV